MSDPFNMTDEEFAAKERELAELPDEPTEETVIPEEETSLENEVPTEEEIPLETEVQTDSEETSTEEPAEESAPLDASTFQELITKPIKVNGAEVVFDNPDQIREMLSKGMDYTKKTQELATHRRMIDALQNNGLLSDDKINHVVDILQGKPEAIKHLLKEKGIDETALFASQGFGSDETEEVPYKAEQHVTPQDAYNFKEAITQVSATEEGKQILNNFKEWDQESQAYAFQDPAILRDLENHKSKGIYDKINAIIVDGQVKGTLPTNVPFLQLYKTIFVEHGDSLVERKPIAVKEGNVGGINKPNPLASKASPNRSTPAQEESFAGMNVFDMTDEQLKAFEKQIYK